MLLFCKKSVVTIDITTKMCIIIDVTINITTKKDGEQSGRPTVCCYL